MEIDDEVIVMGYEIVDPEGAIMLLSAKSKIHLFVNDKKLSNPDTIRSVSAALQWFNSRVEELELKAPHLSIISRACADATRTNKLMLNLKWSLVK